MDTFSFQDEHFSLKANVRPKYMSRLMTKPTKWSLRLAKTDQPGHPPNLIIVFDVRSVGRQGPKLSSCGQRKLWSDWADAQADLSLRWAHMPFSFFLSLIQCISLNNYAVISRFFLGSREFLSFFFLSFFLSFFLFFSLNNGIIRQGRGDYENGAEVTRGRGD